MNHSKIISCIIVLFIYIQQFRFPTKINVHAQSLAQSSFTVSVRDLKGKRLVFLGFFFFWGGGGGGVGFF